jgi:hypothetical protein
MQSQWRSRSDWNVGWRACVRYGTGNAATGTLTARTIRAISGSIVRGPRMQFKPTTSAPASASIRQQSSGDRPSRVTVSRWIVIVTAARNPAALMIASASFASEP